MDKINEKLAEIARKKQEMEAEIAERIRREYAQSQEALAHQESVLIEAAAILGVNVADLQSHPEPSSAPSLKIVPSTVGAAILPPKKFGQKYVMPVADAVGKAMVDKGGQLPLNEISTRLAAMDINPSKSSLRSILSQYDKRFKRVDVGVYDLVDRAGEEARWREAEEQKMAVVA